MQQPEIHRFLERYFIANECEILENAAGYLSVQLTVDLDKELMNRPFYWHYLEKTGGQPNPMKLTLITDQNKVTNDLKGEVIHFGSPRLHQIFQSTNKLASYIRLYEHVKPSMIRNGNLPLHPWLGMNLKITYQCDQTRDVILSIGLNLINGMIIDHFQERLESLSLTPKIPDMCFTLSPIIKPKSGIARIKQTIQGIIDNDDHEWADAARERWNKDLTLLDHFYADMDEKPESYETEKQALQDQYEPKVKVSIINGGLFYLTQQSIQAQ
ncbi:YqhG family protein [Bacillus suaedaesalsae]|uniref:YqhG family protein n=1 Tax=Bacillus suaedaesalsae TaxID=2810349 RepID=A0ABS2DIG3_9BACI|nr:YqhG family protein [Bacillus suaedaesalsae]MBM6617308.1 YqhG family protein [Bacillus suaedaesalsae]